MSRNPLLHPMHDPGRMTGTRLLLACVAIVTALALVGCEPHGRTNGQDGTPTPTQPAATGTAAVTAAPTPEEHPVEADPAGTGFNRAAFAGTFTGTLPCADCPGIDETLRLDADGGFELTDVYRERPDSTNIVHGKWLAEAGGTRIRLQPDNKRNVDRVFAIDGGDTLLPLGMDGVRIDSPFDLSLKRSGE